MEFRYRDANNRIDLKCARTSVPATWLTVSHISGPTLIHRCRDQRARVEGPEQTEQFAQLAAAHKSNGWSASGSRSWPVSTRATFTSKPRASSSSGSPRSWQHGRSPRCRMMGRPWLQFLVDRRQRQNRSSSTQHVHVSKQFCTTCSCLQAVLQYMFMSASSSALHVYVCMCKCASFRAARCARSLVRARSRPSVGGRGGETLGAIVFVGPFASFVVVTSFAYSSGSRARQDAAGRGARRSVDGKTPCIPMFR